MAWGSSLPSVSSSGCAATGEAEREACAGDEGIGRGTGSTGCCIRSLSPAGAGSQCEEDHRLLQSLR